MKRTAILFVFLLIGMSAKADGVNGVIQTVRDLKMKSSLYTDDGTRVLLQRSIVEGQVRRDFYQGYNSGNYGPMAQWKVFSLRSPRFRDLVSARGPLCAIITQSFQEARLNLAVGTEMEIGSITAETLPNFGNVTFENINIEDPKGRNPGFSITCVNIDPNMSIQQFKALLGNTIHFGRGPSALCIGESDILGGPCQK